MIAKLSLSLLCSMAVGGSAAPTWAADPPKALEVMRRRDRELSTRLTLSLELRRPANPFDPAQGQEIQKYSITRGGQATALSARSTYSQPPVFRRAGIRDYQAMDFEEHGGLIVWRTQQRESYSAADRNDSIEVKQKLVVGPEGNIRQDDLPYSQVYIYPIGVKENIYEWDQIMMAAGRGLSEKIEKILPPDAPAAQSLGPIPPGMMLINATGTDGSPSRGVWTLLVDPAKDYLVRYGRFTEDGDKLPSLTIRTSGQTGSLARQGTLNISIDRRAAYDISVSIDSVSLSVDTELLDTVRGRVTNSLMTQNSEIIDFRSTKPSRTFISGK